MNLIANTGIQLCTFPLEIDLNNNFKMYFHEWFDMEDEQLKLEIAHLFSDTEIWVKKHDLFELGYCSEGKITEGWETIKEDFESEGKKTIPIDDQEEPGESGCFPRSISNIDWDKFENTWFPFPFFALNSDNKSEFGPTNWCRFKMIPVERTSKTRKYNLLLAFDTRSSFEEEDFEGENLKETPVFTNNEDKDYVLCNDEYKLIAYCSEAMNCDWVDKYLLKHFYNVGSIEQYRGPKPKLNYLAQYIFLIRYLQQFGDLPKITLYSNNVAYGDVDLVVDIGNSRTCAVLFDNSRFTEATPLALQNFTEPIQNDVLNKCCDSFDMRLAFREADFGGKFGLENSRQFVYPSMIRLGKEANRLIHKATNNKGTEKISTFSSPKRFLWDTTQQEQDWEFVWLEGDSDKSKSIYIEGISEQLNSDGSLNTEGDGGILVRYSRKALMTFAFLEILAQAKMQINSYEQRHYWGKNRSTNESTPRKISRIIVTCPAAMSRVEQIALRKCAEDAAIMLANFFGENHTDIKVIPSAKKLQNKESRTEWIYDEATAAQFVYLYAEICDRYLKNTKDYFDIYGKERSDLENYNKKSLTIGSVDIGAGTTDVMIAAYKYDGDAGQCTLTPTPLFWESFYTAGDDLVKELIHKFVIEGKYSPIDKKLRSLGKNPIDLMMPFLGTDNGVSFSNRRLRSYFNLQVSVPIVQCYLELLKENKEETKILSINDIWGNNPPTEEVLDYFKNELKFDFKELEWKYEKNIVAAIVEKTFDKLIGKISMLLSYYDCDIVLLSGRPTSLKPLSDLFLNHFAICPNRLKSMNDYRVGNWYPEDKRYKFIDGNGKFINPKSIITTGAMIGQIAENGGLNGFSLNLKELKDKLLPTTNFFGKLNEQLEFTEVIISPDNNRAKIEVSSDKFRIGVRQFNIPAYPSRPFYTLYFDDYKVKTRMKEQFGYDDNTINNNVKKEKDKICWPLNVTIERNKNEDIELLRIEEIFDANGKDLKKNFTLQVQSMSEIENFWLDSGIFSLGPNSQN